MEKFVFPEYGKVIEAETMGEALELLNGTEKNIISNKVKNGKANRETE